MDESEKIEKSWIKKARKPIIYGVIFAVLTVLLLFLAIKAFMQYKNMVPLREGAVVITDGKLLPENEEKMVVVSGAVTTDGSTITDSDFDVTVQSPYLSRHVEMLQWVNSRGYGNESGYMQTEWCDTVQRDEENDGKRYLNPDSMQFDSATFYSAIQLGEFILSDALCEKYVRLPNRLMDVDGDELSQDGADNNGLVIDGDTYYYDNGDAHGIGDIQIYFTKIDLSNLGTITVMARQEQGMLTVYDNDEISPIGLLYDGIVSKEEILDTETSSDTAGRIAAAVLTVLFAGITALNIRKVFLYKKQYK